MNILDIIAKKRDKEELTKEEIEYFVKGYTEGTITDYQAAALIMAIFINGMSDLELYDIILEEAVSYGIGIVYQDEIDKINILQATKKGLTEAVEQMKIKPNLIMVDALTGIDTLGIPYKSIIKGDAKCYSISAASIIAKVTRDRIMREWDKIYPQYGFGSHKGYGTARHIAALKEYGPCEIHRRSFIKHFVK